MAESSLDDFFAKKDKSKKKSKSKITPGDILSQQEKELGSKKKKKKNKENESTQSSGSGAEGAPKKVEVMGNVSEWRITASHNTWLIVRRAAGISKVVFSVNFHFLFPLYFALCFLIS